MAFSSAGGAIKGERPQALDGGAAFSLFTLLVLFYRIDHNSTGIYF
jgi:hypothetical protein